MDQAQQPWGRAWWGLVGGGEVPRLEALGSQRTQNPGIQSLVIEELGTHYAFNKCIFN